MRVENILMVVCLCVTSPGIASDLNESSGQDQVPGPTDNNVNMFWHLVLTRSLTGADDAYRSFQSGKRVTEHVPTTICDGLLTTVGERNFEVIRHKVRDILLSTDEQIVQANEADLEPDESCGGTIIGGDVGSAAE